MRLRLEPLCGMRNGFAGKPWKPDVSLRPADTVSSAQKEERLHSSYGFAQAALCGL